MKSLSETYREKIMKSFITLPAHFDGKSIVLDTPFKLQPNDKLLVTLLQSEDDVLKDSFGERKEWFSTSLSQLNKAYSEDESEYSLSLMTRLLAGCIV